MRLVFTHLITQYMERKKNGPPGRILKKKWLYFELMIYDKYRGKNTGPQCVKHGELNKTLTTYLEAPNNIPF
jgi:hypothetical protein